MTASDVTADFRAEATELDARDPLAAFRDRFLTPEGSDLVAYFDGNSLGRPVAEVAKRLADFVAGPWGNRLIRSWDEAWLDRPMQVGDRLGRLCLGAGPGQVFVGDSTTVLLYKLCRAAVDAMAAQGRTEIVLDTDNFPTDRYVLEGIAAERGLTLRWIETDPAAGVTLEQVREVVGPQTGLAVFSHVAYRSGHIADGPGITAAVHDAGGVVLWDLSHTVGSVPAELDAWGADLAVGCSYKYLNGGPGAPAWAYVATRHQDALQQPIWGWLGRRDAFEMAAGYEPAAGLRSFVSGTPPILAMVPLDTTLDLIEEAGMAAIRAKSVELTEFALRIADAELAPLGVEVTSPRDPALRGGHVTLRRRGFRAVTATLWEEGVIPDYRDPDGIRIGLSPLSTSFAEVVDGMSALRDTVERIDAFQ
ncbi:aminotransferase class V-fold PLP-dependent enzyme [Phycicoccus sp. M110.8]|uniref:kynureninase n=1 Tax=Phycicoccus sp. M110.8 TaxID=3075433 RepID=UPI0028FDA1EA|nr:aminotransferase class V-fold PLP-dependent enzyme [Phycicoccus sp. M110.8]MDU0312503.1 aminotransferase class V-fold PLP-dependent enzyme [Phycicoccus sp. M110.8]